MSAIHRFERLYAEHLWVERLDITDEAGARFRREHRLQWVPAFVLLNETGRVLWRGKFLPSAENLRNAGINIR